MANRRPYKMMEKMMEKIPEKIIVSEPRVFCDGSVIVGAGHPGVYLDMGERQELACPYCGLVFKRAE